MIDKFDFNENQLIPLREVVFRALRQAILKGEIKPGERLLEIELSHKLGVSRTPVREAIRMLELEGLVNIETRKGAKVAEIEQQELRDVLELRRGLEVLAIQKACERITMEELSRLDDAAEAFSQLVCKGANEDEKEGLSVDLTLLAEADVAFHDVIYEATHNRRLVQLLNNLREQMYRFRVEYLKDEASRVRLNAEHKELCRAIRENDVEKAHLLIGQHIDNQQDVIIRSLNIE